MKKVFWLFVMGIMALGFTSCKDKNGVTGRVPDNLYGTWYGTISGAHGSTRDCMITFSKDGTFESIADYESTYSSSHTERRGTFSFSNNNITLQGVRIDVDSDGNVDTDYNYTGTMEYHNTYLTGLYSDMKYRK